MRPLRALLFLLCSGCPSTPNSPSNPPDAADALAPTEVALCAALSTHGCALGASPSCPSTIAANKIPGGYLTQWAACLYSGADVASCRVPCGDAGP